MHHDIKVIHHDTNTVVPVNNSNTGPDSDDSTDYDNYLPLIPILSQLLETAKGDFFSYVTYRRKIRLSIIGFFFNRLKG